MTTIDTRSRPGPEHSGGSSDWLATLLANTLAIGQPEILQPTYGMPSHRPEQIQQNGEAGQQRVPAWMQPTIQAFGGLRWSAEDLEDGANPTEPAAAAALLRLLAVVLPSESPVPSIVPTWRGGVQAEWHENGVYLEIEADPDGSIEYYFSNAGEEAEGSASDYLADLAGYARRLSGRTT